MNKINLTEAQWGLLGASAAEKGMSADVHDHHDVCRVIDMAKYALGREVADMFGMSVAPVTEQEFRLLVKVDDFTFLATRPIEARELSYANDRPAAEFVRYVLSELLDYRNRLIANIKEAH